MDRSEATGVTPVRDRRALAASARPIKRRRRFRLEEKQTILKAAAEPGATVSEVSRQYGVGRSLIHNWRRQEALAVLGATVRFAPVAVAAETRVWLASGTTDMRRGFDGLALLVQETLKRDPHCGHLFVFRGKRGGLIKVLWHDGQGMCLAGRALLLHRHRGSVG